MLQEKSIIFATRIINLYKFLCDNKKEYIIAKQIFRSGTSIGANIAESRYAESRNDFLHKLSISLKEANETHYWLILLEKGEYIDNTQFSSLENDIKELIKMLISATKKLKN
ncbi:four helix bundle protein [Flammeovirga sp. MY04]|uniref:four helix bundle protein n=1 Tax=Flammeovirga sp. MY04 TaxID=1191459 RepID=UPI00082412A7|nr:four helix bundle protein [Flammeovirga sp. MY04]ANQ48252.2 four helix bundle protein [Flammeovirga sp. MY04]